MSQLTTIFYARIMIMFKSDPLFFTWILIFFSSYNFVIIYQAFGQSLPKNICNLKKIKCKFFWLLLNFQKVNHMNKCVMSTFRHTNIKAQCCTTTFFQSWWNIQLFFFSHQFRENLCENCFLKGKTSFRHKCKHKCFKLYGQMIFNNQQAHILKKTLFVTYDIFGNVW